jgi:hypothetical protein
MASAIEAPASNTAEGPTQHTQNQAARPANTFGYTRQEQIEALHKLREPFAPAEIRHLPRVWCGACKGSRGDGCPRHPMTKCGKCKQRMPNGGHIDLAYVGHAEATNRLLNVDPFWGWEPVTMDERGLPQVDGYRGLWIRLTVCGMDRLGYGHAGDKTGGDAVKELIGDAIRNAGMRFGMALDLWTTSDLEIIESGGASLEQDRQEDRQPPAPDQGAQPDEDAFQERVRNGWNHLGATEMALAEAKQKGINTVVPFEGDHLNIQDVLEIRIKALKEKAAQGGVAEGQAA